jgi:hypothetical protein
VLDEILLRRTKTTRAEDIQLPPRIVRVRQERLDCRCVVYCNILVGGCSAVLGAGVVVGVLGLSCSGYDGSVV